MDQMLFIKTEDLLLNHQQTLDKIFKFLDIPKFDKIKPVVIFSNTKPPMSKFDKQILHKIFIKEIVNLENLLSLDLSNWKK